MCSIVRDLPNLGRKRESVCEPCQLGKQIKVSHKKSTSIAAKKPLDLVHIANNLVKEHTRKAWIKKYDVKNIPSHSFKHVSNDNSLNIVYDNDNHVKKNVKKIWLKRVFHMIIFIVLMIYLLMAIMMCLI